MKTYLPHITHLHLPISFALILFVAGPLMAALPPLVSVSVFPSVIDPEIVQPAQFTITLSAPAPKDIGIVFSMSGNGRFGLDYTISGNFNHSGEILIPAGQTVATVTLTPRVGDGHSRRENATMNLFHDNDVPHTYRLGSPTRANVILEIQ
jgi:hypothetical protein